MKIAPSNFANDPYGYATNQFGHGGGVGLGMAIYGNAVFPSWYGEWPSAMLVYWLLIELGLQKDSRPGNRSFFDGIEDAMHVGFGVGLHSAILAGPNQAAMVFTAWMAAIGFGAWLRT